MTVYAITNLSNAAQYARKARRSYYRVARRGNTVAVAANQKPWSELTNYMTNRTQIISTEYSDDEVDVAAKEN